MSEVLHTVFHYSLAPFFFMPIRSLKTEKLINIRFKTDSVFEYFTFCLGDF